MGCVQVASFLSHVRRTSPYHVSNTADVLQSTELDHDGADGEDRPSYSIAAADLASLTDTVPLSAVDARLWAKKPAYELTGDKGRDLHRVYIDLDGETEEELSDAAFDQLKTTMTTALRATASKLDWGANYVAMESCEKDNAVKRKGRKVSILSFRQHATHLHGTKEDIEAYATHVLLPELKMAVAAAQTVVSSSSDCSSTAPRLEIMLSSELAKLKKAGKLEEGVFCVDLDKSVYSEGRKMRMLHTCKPDDYTRPMRLVAAVEGQPPHTAIDTLITYVPEDSQRLQPADSYTSSDAPSTAAAGKKRKSERAASPSRSKKQATASDATIAASDVSASPEDEEGEGEEVTSASTKSSGDSSAKALRSQLCKRPSTLHPPSQQASALHREHPRSVLLRCEGRAARQQQRVVRHQRDTHRAAVP